MTGAGSGWSRARDASTSDAGVDGARWPIGEAGAGGEAPAGAEGAAAGESEVAILARGVDAGVDGARAGGGVKGPGAARGADQREK